MLRKYKISSDKITDWYVLMNRAKILPEIMMPTLNDIIKFIDENQNTIFAIASMIESDSFIFDMMKYCFESKGRISPFTPETIVGSNTVNKYGGNEIGKLKHINVILKNIGLSIPYEHIAVIDDNKITINNMKLHGICGIPVEMYFTIADWNRNSCGFEKVLK